MPRVSRSLHNIVAVLWGTPISSKPLPAGGGGVRVLFRLDRLALGADTGSLPEPRTRYEEMSDEELAEELRKVRARNIIQ